MQWVAFLCLVPCSLAAPSPDVVGAFTDSAAPLVWTDAVLPPSKGLAAPKVSPWASLTNPAAGELRGTPKASPGITFASETAADVLALPAVYSKSGTDPVCQGIENTMEGFVKLYCNTSKTVTCVWGNSAVCSAQDYCKFTADCGYVVDNPFLKFDGYSCDITNLAKLQGIVSCNPTLTPLAVGAIVLAVLAFACCCFACIFCICCHHRR